MSMKRGSPSGEESEGQPKKERVDDNETSTSATQKQGEHQSTSNAASDKDKQQSDDTEEGITEAAEPSISTAGDPSDPKKGLITLDDIKGNFAISNIYGESGGWPRQTILLYKTMDEWKRLDNGIDKHAEIRMCDALAESDVSEVEMILNYSPCKYCCLQLINLNVKLKCRMKIRFANFYNSHEDVWNLLRLVKLLINGVELYIFENENDWKYLFTSANLDYVGIGDILSSKRKERQNVDFKILEAVYTVRPEIEKFWEYSEAENKLIAIGKANPSSHEVHSNTERMLMKYIAKTEVEFLMKKIEEARVILEDIGDIYITFNKAGKLLEDCRGTKVQSLQKEFDKARTKLEKIGEARHMLEDIGKAQSESDAEGILNKYILFCKDV